MTAQISNPRYRALVLTVLLILGPDVARDSLPVHGMAFSAAQPGLTPGGEFADILSTPNNRVWWDSDDITYQFTAAFDAAFPSARLKDQVRLAFEQWDGAQAMPHGTLDSYKHNGYEYYADIRTIAVHEIGHVLGLAHVNQAHPYGRNYQKTSLTGCTTVGPAAPPVGEIMQQYIDIGKPNQVLSHDELDAYCFSYGTTDLDFTEVAPPPTSAMITITAGWMFPQYFAATSRSVTPRCADVPTCGSEITAAAIVFNTSPMEDFVPTPVGLMTKGINWDFVSTSAQPTRAFAIRTKHTSNPAPLWHYDNGGPHNFAAFTSDWAGDPDSKEKINHTWSNPVGGDIPIAETIHVGLEHDVPYWVVDASTVIDAGLAETAVAALAASPWTDAETVPLSVSRATSVAAPSRALGSERGPAFRAVARGFYLTAPGNIVTSTVVSELRLADVDELDLGLADLNRATLEKLEQEGRVQHVTDFITRELRAGADFYVVLQGSAANLPAEVQQAGNFLIATDQSDLIGREYLVYVSSVTAAGRVGTYALLGTPPIAGRPRYTIFLPCAGALFNDASCSMR